MKKLLSLTISMILVIFVASVSVFAMTESKHRNSTAGKAGSFHSENTYSVSSKTLSTICGGDVGTYIYYPKVGLQNSFVRSKSRKMTVNLYEVDSGSKTLARRRIGKFDTLNGLYIPIFWNDSYTNTARIESDSCPELQLCWKIDKVKGDKSTSVPAGIIDYTLWVY